LSHPKKVGALPVADTQQLKQTNEIKTAIPLLETLQIQGKDITADALLTQRAIAHYLVTQRNAHYHFTVKANQATLLGDIALFFQNPAKPDFTECSAGDHGRIEIRSIWTTSQLAHYLDFPHVKQAFMIKRESTNKKTGKHSCEIVFGITSRDSTQADAQQLLAINRGHWVIENSCHYILDWIYDEDRSRIRTGYGPENITRLRRFAIGVIKSKGVTNVAQKMRQLTRNVRLVFDYLRMTENSSAAYTKL
jgi:predicted transposase YbfD/YdcC